VLVAKLYKYKYLEISSKNFGTGSNVLVAKLYKYKYLEISSKNFRAVKQGKNRGGHQVHPGLFLALKTSSNEQTLDLLVQTCW
jgi:hypothetical protein